MPAPTVSSIAPNVASINGGSTATITGTNFTGTTGVTIGGVAATSVVVVNATTITCVLPAASIGVASILVTNGSGTNAGNALLVLIGVVPTDTYIYLNGSRGDAFVPSWTGAISEVVLTEKGEPYRNSVFSQLEASGGGGSSSRQVPYALAPVYTVGTTTLAAYEVYVDDAAKDTASGNVPPRQFDKLATWLYFTSANGLIYHYRKDKVIGWGSQPRQ
jgi:IPT/TIG domain